MQIRDLNCILTKIIIRWRFIVYITIPFVEIDHNLMFNAVILLLLWFLFRYNHTYDSGFLEIIHGNPLLLTHVLYITLWGL